jgi:hypothetical protein
MPLGAEYDVSGEPNRQGIYFRELHENHAKPHTRSVEREGGSIQLFEL